jgi:hypothetical protein
LGNCDPVGDSLGEVAAQVLEEIFWAIARQKAEGRRQKAEGRRQKAEGRRQKAEG